MPQNLEVYAAAPSIFYCIIPCPVLYIKDCKLEWVSKVHQSGGGCRTMSFSPDLPFSPVSSLSFCLNGLTCRESDTPKRRLKLSPDDGNPSPEDLLVATENKTPTGRSPISPCGLEPKRRHNSRTPTRPKAYKPMRLLDKIQMNAEGNLCRLGKENDHDCEQSRPPLSSSITHIGSKRGELEDGLQTPAQKKRKSRFLTNSEPESGRVYNFRRLFSSQKIEVEDIADAAEKQIICDPPQACLLPVEEGKHQDLKYIAAQTVAELLMKNFDHLIDEYVIVDCRYPYEYKGGHIKGALNLYTDEQLVNTFFPTPLWPGPARGRSVIIFHCEFSSQRAPRICRSLRRLDRNINVYPRLCFPELYLLKDGYKHFFQQFEILCEPRGYVQMHHKDHREELRAVRRKAGLSSGRCRRKELLTGPNAH
ncbi:M-phase inducer phosphatase 3-like isoform X1 [Amblyraja radiata]|uniref:M-phase inducer phosphatase 3-like isoform X1 n=1 Tax=Amblyraja radiata TaxID=386614 RepID=UPI00140315E2|nr:M-phase inducer phosphatase 3-like isoform X1 [Amblyraja radiata]